MIHRNPYDNQLLAMPEPASVAELAARWGPDRCTWGFDAPVFWKIEQGQRVVKIGRKETRGSLDGTFHDFLVYSARQRVFDDVWIAGERAKPLDEQHQVSTWFAEWERAKAAASLTSDNVRQLSPNGLVQHLVRFCYDILICQANDKLEGRIRKRLRDKMGFQGARYELHVRSIFLRAGFTLHIENERLGTIKRCEFNAALPRKGTLYSVEAKSRHRPGVFGFPGSIETTPNPGLKNLVKEALGKTAAYQRVVFVDMNLPDDDRNMSETAWAKEISAIMDELQNDESKRWPPALFAITNEPFHYFAPGEKPKGDQIAFCPYNLPKFGEDHAQNYSNFPGLCSLFVVAQQFHVPWVWPNAFYR